jgi:hypothetical protein
MLLLSIMVLKAPHVLRMRERRVTHRLLHGMDLRSVHPLLSRGAAAPLETFLLNGMPQLL